MVLQSSEIGPKSSNFKTGKKKLSASASDYRSVIDYFCEGGGHRSALINLSLVTDATTLVSAEIAVPARPVIIYRRVRRNRTGAGRVTRSVWTRTGKDSDQRADLRRGRGSGLQSGRRHGTPA